MSDGTRTLAQGSVSSFSQLRDAEHEDIKNRRGQQTPPRPEIAELPPPKNGAVGPPVYNLSGLALSGGGIRSAAFCLGALQAIDEFWGLKSVDYLSTVSGGGYIGSAVTASMAKTGKFAFAAPDDHSDSLAIGHIRNYSNYLLPRGEALAFLRSLSVILRGLIANICLILVVMVPSAALLIWRYRCREDLWHGSFLIRVLGSTSLPIPFLLTTGFVVAVAAFSLGWAIWRSFFTARGGDVRGPAADTLSLLILLTCIVAFFDLQPIAVASIFTLRDVFHRSHGFWSWIESSILALAPLGTAAAFFANNLGKFLKSTQRTRRSSVMAARIAARLALLLGALVVPLTLWVTYLCLCMVGIENGLLKWYLLAFSLLFLITILFKPNANSLHRLYRDRLSKAFLFNPDGVLLPGGDFPGLDDFPLNKMSPPNGGPYHLINAALNIQASKTANRRGRNADFFLFSSRFIGSESTSYVDTNNLKALDGNLDLATAMAVSGAAASSEMGSKSISLLAPTLALLNVRLGYWMSNPKFIKSKQGWVKKFSDISKFYLLLEMFGQLTEDHRKIYLTDGGHIENLGIYQLLRRGCRFIVAIDAEADPEMGFPSLIALQRYARIDLGIRIDLPWQEIADASNKVSAAVDKGEQIRRELGPHCALGTIHYPNGVDGYLLYMKSSLSGDENDYILDYKRRNPDFPHETTSDQFFSEEQFEVYRALGFHGISSAFQDEAGIAFRDFAKKSAIEPPSDGRSSVMSPAYLKLREIFDELG